MSPTPLRLRLPLVSSPSAAIGDRLPVRAGGEADEALLQVGELAKAAGKTVRAIHLYEELGLLAPHARSKGRFRLFGADALVRVRFISKLQELGLSLSEIQNVVAAWERAASAPGAMREVRATYEAKLAETRSQIARLRSLEAELSASLQYLDTCDTCDPGRLLDACPRCDVHAEGERAPELVAGFGAGRRAELRVVRAVGAEGGEAAMQERSFPGGRTAQVTKEGRVTLWP